SALIHFFPTQLSTHAYAPLQLLDDGSRPVGLLLAAGIISQPVPKLVVECRMLCARPFPGGFYHALIGTKGNVLHDHTMFVYTFSVYRPARRAASRTRLSDFHTVLRD